MRCLPRFLLSQALLYLAVPVCSATHVPSAIGDDWPQFLGATRNGVSNETALIDSFAADGPKVRWRVTGGVGMSAIAVQDDNVITTWNRDGKQWLVNLDATTGKSKWETELGTAYENAMGDGPRATPAITGEQVVTYTGEGILVAVNLQSGKVLWRTDVMKELSAEPSEYGMSSSPLVVGDKVVVHAGAEDAAVVAYSLKEGKFLWKSGGGHAGYSSPMLLELAGQQQVVSATGSTVLGIDPNNGDVLWSYPFETDYGCNTASPIMIDGGVFISAGENHGSVLLDVKKEGNTHSVSERWKSLATKSVMRNEWQTSIVVGDYLYGFDNVGAAGPVSHFSCIEAKTGKAVWQQSRFGKGNLVYADGKFFLTTIDGELVIAKADASGFKELGRAPLVGKNRQTISISNGFGYLRDDAEVVCVQLSK
jgi:outer membrane protein assembly factor BamB